MLTFTDALGGFTMNILLTGSVQIGKTTLLNTVIKTINTNVHGFYTKPYFEDGLVIGYKMFDYTKTIDPFIIGIKDTPSSCQPITENFENEGVSILSRALESNAVIILDELGILESKAVKFREKIIDCLDSKNLVIGVIKKKHSTFLNQIRERKDVIIIDVTLINRDFLIDEIMSLLKKNSTS